MRLNGKIVIVTGASKGIGRAIAVGMAKEGANVVVNFQSDRAGAERVVAEIGAMGRKGISFRANVSRVDNIESMFEFVKKEFGRLDVLVNNAAITGWTPLFDITEKQWDEVIDTNLKGAFFCSLAAARMMKGNGGGSIVNVSSNVAARGVKNLVAYASSKGGIHAMTKQLATELAPYNIRVNTFAPGPTRVGRNLEDDPDYDNHWGPMVPLGRTAAAEEMIGPAVFLASNDSSYMTGQIFYVDGGWTAAGQFPHENVELAVRKRR